MRNHLDQYFTPPEITAALLERLSDQKMRIAEPCAGEGWISCELMRAGHSVVAGDVDRAMSVEHAGVDFFSWRASRIYARCDAIITNPPYTDAARYVRRALELTPNVAMLLRLSFLEPGPDRAHKRSITPSGFARAFFESNP